MKGAGKIFMDERPDDLKNPFIVLLQIGGDPDAKSIAPAKSQSSRLAESSHARCATRAGVQGQKERSEKEEVS